MADTKGITMTRKEIDELSALAKLKQSVTGKVLAGIRMETSGNATGYSTITLRVMVQGESGWFVDELAKNANIEIRLLGTF